MIELLERWARRLRVFLRGEREWEELDEEMRFHVEMEAREIMARRGLDAAEARRRALVAFGGVDRYREEVRGAMGVQPLDAFVRDLRYGTRSLARSPGFTAVALAVLALGIGATTAIFAVVNGVLLRPLPYPEADRLVSVYHAAPVRGEDRGRFSLPNFRDFRERTGSLASMGLYSTLAGDMVFLGEDTPREVETALVAGDFFATLGVAPALGRAFGPEADREARRVVVLSHAFWQGAFGGDPSVVGRSLTLDHESYRVAAVMPPGFGFPEPGTEVWVPITVIPSSSIPLELRFVRFPRVVGRLAPGVTPERSREELSAVAAALAEEFPEANAGLTAATVIPLRDDLVGDVDTALWLVLGAVGFILLIACVNVANLLLVRGTRRRGELAIRMGLGAGQGRVVRQLLTESLLLAVGGGALGALLAWWGGRFLLERSAGLVPRVGEVGVDGSVLGFAVGLTLITTLVFGVLPALRSTGLDVSEELKDGGRGAGDGRGGATLRRSLVAVEVAVAVALLAGAGLMVRSLGALGEVELGFEPEGVASLYLVISDRKHPERPQYTEVYETLMREIGRLPGVESVASLRLPPLRGAGDQIPFVIPGIFEPPEGERTFADLVQVSEDLFRTLGVRLVAGRSFDGRDGPDDPIVTVVNETLVEDYFGGRDPVGRSLRVGDVTVEVVGVVEDLRHHGVGRDPRPTIYVHQPQIPRRAMAFMVRAADGDAASLLGPLRRVVRSVDPEQAIGSLTTLDALARESVARPRFFTLLMGSFAAVALLLSALGVYGVLAYAVRQRSRELGLRMALGARAPDVAALVLRDGLAPVAVGLLAGMGMALALSRFMESLLFGVTPVDPATYGAVALGLALVAVLACLVPARSAARVDPAVALREGR